MKALIPAAGLGTRFLPATKAMPKEMAPVVDRPVIQYVVEEAVSAGITDILMVISRGKRLIEEHFDGFTSAHIHYVWQDEPRGLGHAVLCGRHHIGGEPFALLLGDTIMRPQNGTTATQRLMELHQKTGTSVVALERVERARIHKYGIVDAQPCDPADGRAFRVSGLVEKPGPADAPSDLAVASRYILTPDIFGLVERSPPGKNNEIQITDALNRQARATPIHGCLVDSERLDVGNPLGFLQANLRLALEDPALRGPLLARAKT